LDRDARLADAGCATDERDDPGGPTDIVIHGPISPVTGEVASRGRRQQREGPSAETPRICRSTALTA
jgi:hypothetical protein